MPKTLYDADDDGDGPADYAAWAFRVGFASAGNAARYRLKLPRRRSSR